MKIHQTTMISSLLIALALNAHAYSPAQTEKMIGEMNAAKAVVEQKTEKDLERFTVLKNAKGDLIEERVSKKAPQDLSQWALLDPKKDKIEGTSTARLYNKVGDKIKANGKEIIVAVVDSGVDIHHEDLRGMIWENKAEINGIPGVDDDGNGYVDDFNGWNFLGNNDGTNVGSTTLEVTREVVRLKKKKASDGLSKTEEEYFQAVSAVYLKAKSSNIADMKEAKAILNVISASTAVLKAAGLKDVNVVTLTAFKATDVLTVTAKETMLSLLNRKITSGRLQAVIANAETAENFYYNPDFDSSDIVGDNPAKLDEKGYGNNDVIAEGADHGTHVSGIIAAVRENSKGVNGQAVNVKIMPVRAVPDGDERDKDVANAIRYAVDNGANIINMSFGKPYSPYKKQVDEAMAYAEKKGVLLVHAAGNDGKNTETAANFPSNKVSDGTSVRTLANWIEVGASDKVKGLDMPAYFSNYGKTTVDVFAPGVKILSTVPGNEYAAFSGTSMATPEVVGVAALTWSMNRSLTAPTLRQILLDTSTKYKGLMVNRPVTDDEADELKKDPSKKKEQKLFSDLSATGGIVNALKAMKKAI